MTDQIPILDVPLTVEQDTEAGWWHIVRAEHEHVEETRYDADGGYQYNSADLGDCSLDATAKDMRDIGEALRLGRYLSTGRCAVVQMGDLVALWSPRNSLRPVLIPEERAAELAEIILRTVKP